MNLANIFADLSNCMAFFAGVALTIECLGPIMKMSRITRHGIRLSIVAIAGAGAWVSTAIAVQNYQADWSHVVILTAFAAFMYFDQRIGEYLRLSSTEDRNVG
jgi:hypothetical protein